MIRVSLDPHAPPPARVLQQAADVLRNGGVVGYPTESSYALGACSLDREACARIYRIKGRDPGKPLPLLIPHVRWLHRWSRALSSSAYKLARAFWPGALTLVVQAHGDVPAHLVSGGAVGLRMPAYPVALELVREAGMPVTGTSANRSGESPVMRGELLEEMFGSELDMILDVGPTPGNPPSTVLDATVDPPRVLRQGALEWERIRRELEKP